MVTRLFNRPLASMRMSMLTSQEANKDPQKVVKNEFFMKMNGKRDSGLLDNTGKSMTWNEYKKYKGPSFTSQDEYESAINLRESFSSSESSGNQKGLLGNRKRVNIFGN